MTEKDTRLATEAPTVPEEEIVQTHHQSLGYVLARAHFVFRQHMTRALVGSGLHLGQVAILGSLRAQEQLTGAGDANDSSALTQTRLTQITGIEKSSLVLFLDALEKDGWVERRRHPTDRRAYIVHLTVSGLERFHTVSERMRKHESECLAPFNGVERQQMSEQLLRLTRHIQALEEGVPANEEARVGRS